MANNIASKLTRATDGEPSDVSVHKTQQQFISELPIQSMWCFTLHNYKGFWVPQKIIESFINMESGNFTPRTSDIFLVSMPKSGSTWLKALAFSALNRKRYFPLTSVTNPLLTLNPHECVPFIESSIEVTKQHYASLESLSSPRLLAAHSPFSLFPSIITDVARFIYICRDPKDNFTSFWHFYKTLMSDSQISRKLLPLDEGFKLYCNGIVTFGPIWEHVLEYWRASQQWPYKVLFLQYEEMIRDPPKALREVAEFMGCKFSEEEEKIGLVDDLARLCSFDRLSNLEHNQNGHFTFGIKNMIYKKSSFFRQGKVGDWVNLLTPKMGKELDKMTSEKFKEISAFSF